MYCAPKNMSQDALIKKKEKKHDKRSLFEICGENAVDNVLVNCA